jgi:hypothetical protein
MYFKQDSPAEDEMAKFLTQAVYTADGVKGLMKEGGSSRKTAVAYRAPGA